MKKLVLFAIGVLLAVSAAEPGSAVPSVAPPIWLDKPAAGMSDPPHWVPKRPGHYGLTDWRQVIDATWGPGLPVGTKLAIFDSFWNTIDSNFACFNNITVNWDSLRTGYRPEIEDTVSRGRFAAIMNHLGMALREGHTSICDVLVNWNTNLLPGVPLWVVGAWGNVYHFGAGLTPLSDSSLLVYRVVNGHPLGLERGDVVLGYDRRPWTEILRELQEAQLPLYLNRCLWCSCSTAMTHALLNGAGMNWHLFDTVDIVKYATGDTVHLPTSLLVGQNMQLSATDQMDIPGVSMPGIDSTPSVTYGVVSGTRIGYIYSWKWQYNAGAEFYDAVNALVSDTTLKGIILDFRYNTGGNMFLSDSGLQLLFRDSVSTICMSARSDPGDHFAMKVTLPAQHYVIPGNGVGYDKPIAVLVGPGAISSGDQVAFRMTFHPRVKTFGKSTNTAFSGPTTLDVNPNWYARYACSEYCLSSDTTYFLTHREFPVDVPVWHTRDAVASGEDTVVTAAMAWIDSVAAGVEETPNAQVRTTNLATIDRGVLELPGLGTRSELPGRNSVTSRAVLLDISGRKVMDLHPGANDVRALVPGVYFVHEGGVSREQGGAGIRKVVIAR